MNVTLSIAIVTRNRPESLERTLISLSKQVPQAFEILISDDSDSDFAISINKKLAESYKCKYISGPNGGLYANRNFAAKNCTGSHIRTMDDDHRFPVDHLAKCICAIYREPETIWTIGEYYNEDNICISPYPVPGQLHPRGFSYYNNDLKNYFGISCGATIYPQSVISKEILNCELYKFGSIYLEYGARLKNCGYTLKPLTDTYFIHESEASFGTEAGKKHCMEARIFSMFCLSFRYRNTFMNKVCTVYQLLIDYLKGDIDLTLIRRAYLNYKKFTENMQALKKGNI